MTALKVAQNIANEVGLQAPTSLVGNPNQDAIRLKAAINAAGRYLSGHDWNSLTTVTTISCSTTTEYALPSGFRAMVPLTLWNTTEREQVTGPMTPSQWQVSLNALGRFSLSEEVRIKMSAGTQFLEFRNTTEAGNLITIYYYTENWVNSGSMVASISADNDTFLLPERVVEAEAKWRFLKAIGQSFGQEYEEAKEVTQIARANDGGLERIRAPQPWRPTLPELF